MRNRQSKSTAEKEYRSKLRSRRTRQYLVLVVFSLITLFLSAVIFIKGDIRKLQPQINCAVKQLSELIPRLEDREAALRGAYDKMADSLENILTSDVLSGKGYTVERSSLDEVILQNLSWMDCVTSLRVGRDGYMFVVDKNTDRILAHPQKEAVGRKYFTSDDLSEGSVISLSGITADMTADDLDPSLGVMDPMDSDGDRKSSIIDEALADLRITVIGVVVDYGDTYIVCGIPITELLTGVLSRALVFSVFFIIFVWLFVKWICLVTESRRETVRSFRTKLVSHAVIACLSLFFISWFTQVLSDVTNDLKAMEKHADVAVENLNTFRKQGELINNWLDTFYVYETMISAKIVELKGKENLTRSGMQEYADYLDIKYIYLFDQQGNVMVTNSPYDHLTLSEDPDDPTYQMRALLDGVAGAITKPFKDERTQENIQLVGISLRNSDDLCDGFVMITVDTRLRESLVAPLSVQTVLDNLVIGLPDYALAVDKNTLEIVATTGIGYTGEDIGILGLKKENLEGNFSGFLRVDGSSYYAGVGETEDLYLIPIVRRSGELDSFWVALRLTLCAVCAVAVLIFLALFRYQRDVIDAAPETRKPSADGSSEDGQAEEARHGILSGLSNAIHIQKKKGLDERWHINRIPKDRQTPEQRIARIIYWLMLIFCFAILFPTLYASLDHGSGLRRASSLTYIVSGNWQKGFNIFSITYCLFLFCAMNVVVVLLERILYLIALVSGMRTETVCLLIRNSLKYICVIIFIYAGLAKFGVDTATLLASAGILTLMISLGAKDLVSDIIAGFFIILEGSYKVGDFISVGGWIGTVVEIGLRTTRVRFYSDTKIFNNSSLRDLVNSDGPVARMVLSMPIGYDENLEKIEAILAEELPKMKDDIPGLVRGPEYEGVDSFESSCVMLRIVIYMETPFRYAAYRRLKRDMKLMFDRRGIQIPFNQIVVHDAKDGEDPPIKGQ